MSLEVFLDLAGERLAELRARAYNGEIEVYRYLGRFKTDYRDAMGRQVISFATEDRVDAYFVDPSPYANWTHPCHFAFVEGNGITWVPAGWPPQDQHLWEQIDFDSPEAQA